MQQKNHCVLFENTSYAPYRSHNAIRCPSVCSSPSGQWVHGWRP